MIAGIDKYFTLGASIQFANPLTETIQTAKKIKRPKVVLSATASVMHIHKFKHYTCVHARAHLSVPFVKKHVHHNLSLRPMQKNRQAYIALGVERY